MFKNEVFVESCVAFVAFRTDEKSRNLVMGMSLFICTQKSPTMSRLIIDYRGVSKATVKKSAVCHIWAP